MRDRSELVSLHAHVAPDHAWWWLPGLPAAGSAWCPGGQKRSLGAGANSACTMRPESAAQKLTLSPAIAISGVTADNE